MQREAKVRLAAQHNAKAANVVVETREAHERAVDELKANAEADMHLHLSRHDAEVHRVKIKGAHEVEKVHSALAALQEAQAEKARVQQDAMEAAQQRRAASLQQVAAKGQAESEKVDQAATRLQVEAEAKAAILDAASASAAERRAAKLSAIAAKGAAEARKVEKVVGRPLLSLGSGPSSPQQDGSGKVRPAPASPDSVLWDSASGPPPPPPPQMKPPTPPRALQYGEASLLLLLLRAGAPNAEVLNASGATELAAIAKKYAIPIPEPSGVDVPQQPAGVCA